ncbi:MAG TPA: cation:proton antiporter [Polyangiales bacterium]|nr:cation:proton antiporter [Polyangiales bacterium]
MHLLLALLIVVAFAQLVGQLFRRVGQPPVVGEMFAGIILGPSLLGRFAPDLSGFLLPNDVVPYLRAISQIGVVLYMFLVGLELDVRQLKQRAGTAMVISASGIAVPLLLGSLFANVVYAHTAPPGVAPFLFGAFFCVALSVTAFPVLARIVTERKLDKTMMGTLALTCAAADDISAWCMLSIVVSFAHAEPTAGLYTVFLAASYVGIMLVAVRPLFMRLVRWEHKNEKLSRLTLAILLCSLLVSALITEWIGIHALFGSFLVGALIPSESRLAERTTEQLDNLVGVLFLPIFFAFTGLRTQLNLLEGAAAWGLCAFIVVLAFLGKFGGVSLASRICGVPWRTSFGLGALMNTRGLMELIVLNVGLDLGIISPSLFAMMVVMALVTTCAAGPLLYLIGQERTVPLPAVRPETS